MVYDVLQLLARLEVGNLFGGDLNARAGFGIAADAGLALARTETPKPTDFDFIAATQCPDDAVENGLDDDFSFLPRHLNHTRDFFNQIGFRHASKFPLSSD
jgi:hypothetical protein